MRQFLMAVLALLISSGAALAQTADTEGSKDHPSIARFRCSPLVRPSTPLRWRRGCRSTIRRRFARYWGIWRG